MQVDDQELSPLRSDNISGNFIFILAFVAAPTLVRTKSFHLLSQTARLLESPTGAFIASQPQGRSKRIFHEKGRNGKWHLLALAPCGELPPQRLRGLQIREARKMLLAKRLAFFRFDLCFGIIKGE